MVKLVISVLLFSFFLFPLFSADKNLIKDASFEDKLPLWFNVRGERNYYADKFVTDSAPDGKTVMRIMGWPKKGLRHFNHQFLILSPIIKLSSPAQNNMFSVSIKMRGFGVKSGPEVELSLWDSKGKTKLASIGKIVLTGQGKWQLFEKKGIKLKNNLKEFRFAINIEKSTDNIKERRVELDQIGLFAQEKPGKVSDNSDTRILKLNVQKNAVTRTVNIRGNGAFRLWLSSGTPEELTASIKQNGKIIATTKSTGGASRKWNFSNMKLKKGKADIVFFRPTQKTSLPKRKLDLFILTSNLDYKPTSNDFKPAGYMRFTNLSENQDPFCLWIWVRRHQAPWYANPGILSMSGNTRLYSVPLDKSLWLAKGYTSPWVKISDDLLPGGGRNNVSLTATRKRHVDGFVKGTIKGKLEFALGPDKKIIKTVKVNQDGPIIILSLPDDFKKNPKNIRTAWDFIRGKRKVLKTIKSAGEKRAKYLNLLAFINLNTREHHSKIVKAEMGILKKLGFNGLYFNLATTPDKAIEFYEKKGMNPVFVSAMYDLWTNGGKPDPFHPDLNAIDSAFKKFTVENKAILKNIDMIKVADEPEAMTYKDIVSSEGCRKKFKEDLKENGYTPEQLGVSSWNKVLPVLSSQSDKFPELFYHTAMFRLEGNAILVRAITKVKKKYFKDGALTYVNYIPNWSGCSYIQRGCDPFMMQRKNGLGMLWTEDWLGWGAGVQHVSTAYALLRSAGSPGKQPLGTYVVVDDARTSTLLKMKIFTALAGGVRTLSLYNYGPGYSGIDSWSMEHKWYSPVSNYLHQLANIDQALHETTRRKTDVAILYNRTASIWEKSTYVSEQNAQYTHWALAHAGYDADFIPEEDIVSGKLNDYKVLYIDGIQLRRDAAEKIAAWVKNGGVLFGSAAAGVRDQYNKPMKLINNVFAIDSSVFPEPKNKFVNDTVAMRARYELRALKPLNRLQSVVGPSVPAIKFDQLCLQEVLKPAKNGKVILKMKNGKCAGVRNSYGSGIAIRVAGLPGISYLHEAIKGKNYDIYSNLPKKFSKKLRNFIVWPAKLAKAKRIAKTREPITEIVRYDGKDRAVVFVIDHDAVNKKKISLRLFDAGQFSKAYTASGRPVKTKKQKNNILLVTMPMNVADAIVLEK